MKPKKNAFANSATGYGKNHYKHHNHNKSSKSDLNTKTDNNNNNKKLNKEEKIQNALEEEKNLNSGFGDYLRTPEAVEMMKLFVFANTIMLILTMAWPHMREQYFWLRHWLASFESEY